MDMRLDGLDDHALRGLNLAWAVQHLPSVSLAVVGGMIEAFARSTASTPLTVAERRAIGVGRAALQSRDHRRVA